MSWFGTQVGRHDNVVEALGVATRTEGVKGLFRGTTALLSREVPFYVLGMMGYAQLKKVFNGMPAPVLLPSPQLQRDICMFP